MLTQICRDLNNYFETEIYTGKFVIENGEIDLSEIVNEGDLRTGQYFRIAGSIFNDGIYQYPATELQDEEFNGAVWCMAIPKDFLELVEKIQSWSNTYDSTLNSPYQSESFGGYSYSNVSGNSGGAITWKSQFRSELNNWRKMK